MPNCREIDRLRCAQAPPSGSLYRNGAGLPTFCFVVSTEVDVFVHDFTGLVFRSKRARSRRDSIRIRVRFRLLSGMAIYNEPIVAVIVGLLLALSAGVRMTLPLLAVSLLAHFHEITLPQNVAWLGSDPTLILLGVAFAAETLFHFVPAVGTHLKAVATPLSFVAGTLLMAVPLGDHNPLYQWTLAAVVGGGAASLTNLGLTGARTVAAPANVASLGVFGVIWNFGEMVDSLLLAALGSVCVFAGWIVGAFILVSLLTLVIVGFIKGVERLGRAQPAAS
jgi:hypothetical protein